MSPLFIVIYFYMGDIMEKCWIVGFAEPYECDAVVSVHKTQYGARRAAAKLAAQKNHEALSFYYLGLIYHNREALSFFWQMEDVDYWTNGYQDIYVDEMEVLD